MQELVSANAVLTAVFVLVWLQHSVDSSEDGAEDRRSPGLLPRLDLHHREGDSRLLLLFWRLRTQPLHVCPVHGHRQGWNRYGVEFSKCVIIRHRNM